METVCQGIGENYAFLDFSHFCEEVKKIVEERLGEECEATLRNVVKNNRTEFRSLTIRRGDETVIPTIYLENFYREYEKGAELGEVVSAILRIYEANRNPWPEGIDFSFEGVKERISFRLINFEKNEETLRDMPYIQFEDWAICFECVITRKEGQVGAVRVDNAMMREWETTLDELTELAKKNTYRLIPSKCEPIEEVLAGILIARLEADESLSEEEKQRQRKQLVEDVLEHKEQAGLPMFVLSNALNHYGANALLNIPFMDDVRLRLKEDFFILPSSVHEIIVIPVSAAPSEEQLARMVQEVNANEVPEEEFLAEGVYRYGLLRKELVAALHTEG